MNTINTKNDTINRDFKISSRHENTNILKSIPGLSESLVLELGNCIFIPGLPEDQNKPWYNFKIDIDGKPQIFYRPLKSVNRHDGLSVTPAEAFDYEGANFIFRHTGGIPIIYKKMVLSLALYRKDPNLLCLAYSPTEQIKLINTINLIVH